jgi:hypothetical protein
MYVHILFGGKTTHFAPIIDCADDDALEELASKSLCDFWTPCPEMPELSGGALGLL